MWSVITRFRGPRQPHNNGVALYYPVSNLCLLCSFHNLSRSIVIGLFIGKPSVIVIHVVSIGNKTVCIVCNVSERKFKLLS